MMSEGGDIVDISEWMIDDFDSQEEVADSLQADLLPGASKHTIKTMAIGVRQDLKDIIDATYLSPSRRKAALGRS